MIGVCTKGSSAFWWTIRDYARNPTLEWRHIRIAIILKPCLNELDIQGKWQTH